VLQHFETILPLAWMGCQVIYKMGWIRWVVALLGTASVTSSEMVAKMAAFLNFTQK